MTSSSRPGPPRAADRRRNGRWRPGRWPRPARHCARCSPGSACGGSSPRPAGLRRHVPC
ncbi:hypothetical protein ACFFX0_05400 [Citricoccus parietis]|uniref:Uncharacterized protein n=1 Tax=Citricoccus parietis TaxID=592307 RepID=A0ABV5FVH7_9MICC